MTSIGDLYDYARAMHPLSDRSKIGGKYLIPASGDRVIVAEAETNDGLPHPLSITVQMIKPDDPDNPAPPGAPFVANWLYPNVSLLLEWGSGSASHRAFVDINQTVFLSASNLRATVFTSDTTPFPGLAGEGAPSVVATIGNSEGDNGVGVTLTHHFGAVPVGVGVGDVVQIPSLAQFVEVETSEHTGSVEVEFLTNGVGGPGTVVLSVTSIGPGLQKYPIPVPRDAMMLRVRPQTTDCENIQATFFLSI